MAFKSITAVRGIDWRVGVDLDGLPETIQEVTDHQKQDQFSQEFQLTGNALDDKLDYVLGLYYFQEDGFVHDFVPFGSTLFIYDVANDVDTKSYAAFFHADYNFNDSFGLSLGARWSKDDKKFEGGQADLDGYGYKSSGCWGANGPDMDCWAAFAAVVGLAPFPDPTNPLRYFPPGEQSQEYDVFTPTFGAQWHINPDVMAYFSFSKGFKAGGWTTRLSNPVADIDEAAFGPEESETYELGFKSQFLDHRVQTNVAVFFTDYTGIQLQIQEGASPVSQNAGDAELKGAELELNALIGGGFSIYLGASYIDAEYTRLLTSVQGITLDTDLPKTPKHKYTISPQWDLNLRQHRQAAFCGGLHQDGLAVQRRAEHAAAGAPGYRKPGRGHPLLLARREVFGDARWHQSHRRPLPRGWLGERRRGRDGRYLQPAASVVPESAHELRVIADRVYSQTRRAGERRPFFIACSLEISGRRGRSHC